MIDTVFRSEELPASQRFERWRELLAQAPVPMRASCDRLADFTVHQRDLHLEGLRVWTMTFRPMVFHRTPKLVRESDPETYNVCVLLNGTMGRSWDGREAVYGPDELHVFDSSQPFRLRTTSTRGPVSCVGVEIPRKQLTLPPGRAERLVGRPVPARSGIAALLAGTLQHLTADTSPYRPTDEPHLGTVLGDLVTALFHHVTEDEDRSLRPETHRRTLTARIRQFIRRHLHDPQLTRDAIAAAHHISTSYLHRLFQDDGMPVMAWVRQQRLERARRDLADPALRSAPVGEIGAKWGFVSHSDFTRAFRAAYGSPPRDYRQQALGDQ